MDFPPFHQVIRSRTRRELIAGGVSPARLRGPHWQRTSHGRYLPAGVDIQECLQRIVEASLRLPEGGGAVGGWAAARALGVAECDGLGLDGRTLLDVPLVLGSRRVRAASGIERWFDPLPDSDLAVIAGIRFTGCLRTCLDRMRRAPNVREAVVAADQMTHARVVTLDALGEYVEQHPGWHGIEQARRARAACDPMARNAWETRMRMVWLLDAGLPAPLCNPPVFGMDENLLGYPDLLDPEAGVVFEYDGAGHRRARQHDRDNIREEVFEDHGLVVARVSRANLEDRRALAARMADKRARGLARDRRRDAWTLEIPPSWGAFGFEGQVGPLLDELGL